MRIANIKLNELVTNKIQPGNRTELKLLRELRNSIRDKGLISPILVNEKTLEIIDGHRRAECFKLEEKNDIPCVLVTVENSSDAWVEVNSKTRPIRRKDYIGIYMKGGTVPKFVLNDLLEIVDVLGIKFLNTMNEGCISSRSVKDVIFVCDKLGMDTRSSKINFFKWAINSKSIYGLSRFRYHQDLNESYKKAILKCYKDNTKFTLY